MSPCGPRSPRGRLVVAVGLAAWVFLVPAAVCLDTGAQLPTLFSEHEPLEMTLRADWQAIARHRDETGRRWPADLLYRGPDGDERRIPVELSTRGRSRLDRSVCSFPQLFLHLTREGVTGTLFEAQDSLPLVTHCRTPRWYEQYVVQEYLLYRVYGLLTEWSLDVRPARVTYEPTDRGKAITRFAFFLENFHHLAERRGGEVFEDERFHPNDAEPLQMSLLETFQYMIGNTDWSVVLQHNIVLVRTADGEVVAVPYDLDTAGAVDATYAVPDPGMGIDSVQDRRFRGVCRDGDSLSRALDHIVARRADIEALYRSCRELDDDERRRTLAYFGDFFEELADAQRRRALLASCRRLPGTAESE